MASSRARPSTSDSAYPIIPIPPNASCDSGRALRALPLAPSDPGRPAVRAGAAAAPPSLGQDVSPRHREMCGFEPPTGFHTELVIEVRPIRVCA
ncbi:hypothetical protein GCM10018952_19540 [Streptosporangium vulgare]